MFEEMFETVVSLKPKEEPRWQGLMAEAKTTEIASVDVGLAGDAPNCENPRAAKSKLLPPQAMAKRWHVRCREYYVFLLAPGSLGS